jgi:F-type H+-transporting ATPase subunit gamma
VEELIRLKARIESLGELQTLFSAMRALAAARVQEAQAALGGIRRYASVVEGAIAEAAGLRAAERAQLPEDDVVATGALVLISAEHGFAGAFNRLLLQRAKAELRGNEQLGIVGRRGASLAEEHGLRPAWTLPMTTHVGGVIEVARRVAQNLAPATSVRLVFARYRSSEHFEVGVRQVIPIDPRLLASRTAAAPPLHHLDPNLLLQRLIEEHLFADLVLAMMESLASENGARLQVMKAADRNIDDKLASLTRQSRTVRQTAITAELLDVVTGAEAILQSSPDGPDEAA